MYLSIPPPDIPKIIYFPFLPHLSPAAHLNVIKMQNTTFEVNFCASHLKKELSFDYIKKLTLNTIDCVFFIFFFVFF